MTREEYDALVAEARTKNFSYPERWAWNQAVQRGWHPELSGIPQPDWDNGATKRDQP